MQLTKEIRDKIIAATQKDVQNCGSACNGYRIMRNVYESSKWFMRYTKTHIVDNEPEQIYRWLCFNSEGIMIECDPVFASASVENQYKGAMYLIENVETLFV